MRRFLFSIFIFFMAKYIPTNHIIIAGWGVFVVLIISYFLPMVITTYAVKQIRLPLIEKLVPALILYVMSLTTPGFSLTFLGFLFLSSLLTIANI